jgi:hypothetical protein
VAGEMWTPLDRPPPPLADGMQPLVTGELKGGVLWQWQFIIPRSHNCCGLRGQAQPSYLLNSALHAAAAIPIIATLVVF